MTYRTSDEGRRKEREGEGEHLCESMKEIEGGEDQERTSVTAKLHCRLSCLKNNECR